MYPNSRFRLTLLALLMCLTGQSARADSADDQFALAAAHYSAGRWALAIDEFETFLTSQADDTRCESVRFYLAECHVQKGSLPDARRWFEEYLRESPQGKYTQRAEFRLGETEYLAGDHAAAQEDLQRYCQGNPDDELCAYALVYLGEIELESQNAQAAKESFAECLKRFPEGPLASECRYGLARALETLDDAEGAMRFYRFLSEQANETALRDDALLRLAILQYRAADYGSASQSLQQHVDRFPGSELAAHARYWLGMTQLAQGDHRAAAATLEAAVTRYPQHELAAAMTYAAADSLRRVQERERVDTLCQRVLQEWPSSEWADDSLHTMIQMSWERGRLDETRKLAEQFQEQYPQSTLLPLVQQTLARAAIKSGDYANAVKVLEPAADSAAIGEIKPKRDIGGYLADAFLNRRQGASAAATPATRDANQYYLALALLGESRYQDALLALEPLSHVQEPAELVDGVRVAALRPCWGWNASRMRWNRWKRTWRRRHREPMSSAAGLNWPWPTRGWTDGTTSTPVLDALRAEHQDNDLYESTLEFLAESASGNGHRELARSWFAELGATALQADRAAHGLAGQAWLESLQPESLDAAATTFARLKAAVPLGSVGSGDGLTGGAGAGTRRPEPGGVEHLSLRDSAACEVIPLLGCPVGRSDGSAMTSN